MSFGSFPGTRSGQALPPVEVAQKIELTRGGDPIAREIFEALTLKPLSEAITPAEWRKIQTGLTSNRKADRERARKQLAELGGGRTKRSLVGAHDACCLILATFGLTLEQIGLIFGHPKGHIARKISTARDNYRLATGATEQVSASLDPELTRDDRKRLKRKADRWANAVRRESLPHRRYFIQQFQHRLNQPHQLRRHRRPRRPHPPSAAGR